MKTVVTNEGKEVQINNNMYYVTMTDKFLSGWGKAEGKTHKQVVICKTFKEAQKIVDGLNNLKNCDGMKYINIRYSFPVYSSIRYSVTYREAERCSLWLNRSNIR